MINRYARPIAALCLAAFMVAALPACESGQKGSSTQPASLGVINETCPLSNKPIDESTTPVEYDGQKIGLCCEDCRGMWDKKTAEEKSAYVAKQLNVNMGVINTNCPQRPQNEVDTSLKPAEYNGYKIGFCCGGCEKKWEKRTNEEKDAYISSQSKSNLGVIGDSLENCEGSGACCSYSSGTSKAECDGSK